MAEAPRIQFPHHPPDALRSLVRRFGIAVGIIVVIALLTWLGRNGYSDADGTPISLLDAFYYATVTATTTGQRCRTRRTPTRDDVPRSTSTCPPEHCSCTSASPAGSRCRARAGRSPTWTVPEDHGDPLGADLLTMRAKRILRCSPLTPVEPAC